MTNGFRFPNGGASRDNSFGAMRSTQSGFKNRDTKEGRRNGGSVEQAFGQTTFGTFGAYGLFNVPEAPQ